MFLCVDCVPHQCKGQHMSGSYGPCEGCGKSRRCDDCHHPYPVRVPKKRTPRKEAY